jgi:hypothetical protein
MNYLYLRYGDNRKYDYEMIYSITSLLRFAPNITHNIYLYTDKPQNYSNLKFNVIDISNKINAWSNNKTYMYRIKTETLKHALKHIEGKILFVDSDTIFKKNPQVLSSSISNNSVLLHCVERNNPYPEMNGFITNLQNNSQYKYYRDARLYNSGIIGVTHAHSYLINQTLELIDALHPKFPQIHTIEQLALSEIFLLNKMQICTCERFVKHYWRSILRNYMHYKLENMFEGKSLNSPQILKSTKRITLTYLHAKIAKLRR